jgi:hypothetical protein
MGGVEDADSDKVEQPSHEQPSEQQQQQAQQPEPPPEQSTRGKRVRRSGSRSGSQAATPKADRSSVEAEASREGVEDADSAHPATLMEVADLLQVTAGAKQ